MKLSKSKINTFLKCRYEFKYKYIDELEDKTNAYAQVGLDIHSYAEAIAKALKDQKTITETLIYNTLYNLYPYEKKEMQDDDHAKGLYDFFCSMLVDNNYRIFSVEEYIYDEEHNISGIIDIIFEDLDTGELIIYDYKTGRVNSIKKYMIELCIYRILIESKYPGKKIATAGIFFTKYNKHRAFNFCEKQSKGTHVREKDYQAVFELIDYIRNEIKEERFEPKVQFLCKYCSFYEQCKKEDGRI